MVKTMTNLVGNDLIDFELPYVGEEGLAKLKLSEIASDKKVVLAFFPGAWTGACTKEMCSFRDDMTAYQDLNAEVVGVSVDLPWALNEFKKDQNLNFTLVSDANKTTIRAYDVVWPDFFGIKEVANRSVFVISEGKITYQWVGENPGQMPDFDEVKKALT